MTDKVLVFDFDGTLFDSMHIWDTLASNYLLSKNIETTEILYTTLASMSLLDGCYYLHQHYLQDMTIDEIHQEIIKNTKQRFINEAKPKDGAVEFLLHAKKRNIPMYILSANTREIIISLLKKYHLDTTITAIFTCDELKLDKNSSAIFRHMSNLLNVAPNKMYIFEDSCTAAIAAKNSDCYVIGVQDHYQDKKIQSIVDLWITDFNQLEEKI